MKMRDGAWIAGGNPKGDRIKDDWYATNPEAVRMLLDTYPNFNMKNILEPCVGEGHIANVLKEYSGEDITCIDIINRGYKDTIVTDFLTWDCDKEFDTIITNPPYKLAVEFIRKCISILSQNGQLAMFLKIQFLEGLKRKELFDNYPPKYIYVFRKRMQIFNEGVEINPKTGKKWSSLLCNAWYIWDKKCNTEPIVRWID